MNRKYRLAFCFLFLLVFVFLTGCKPKVKKELIVDPAFTSYVAAFTSGLIPGDAEIRIRLTNDVSGDYAINEPLDLKLFRFSPDIKGDVIMTDKRTFVFKPSERLQPGTEYSAIFSLDDL